MMESANRRGFLRGLAALPLIGGGVTLVGAPTAAAVPITEPLMRRYVGWLAQEHAEALIEWDRIRYAGRPWGDVEACRRTWMADNPLMTEIVDPIARANVLSASPGSRAALVLSAVGCARPEVRS